MTSVGDDTPEPDTIPTTGGDMRRQARPVTAFFILLCAGLLAAAVSAKAFEPTTGQTTENVRLRKGPGTEHPVLAGIAGDTPVQVIDASNGWYRVQVTKNHLPFDGWIYGRYIRLDDPADTKQITPAPPVEPPPAPIAEMPSQPAIGNTVAADEGRADESPTAAPKTDDSHLQETPAPATTAAPERTVETDTGSDTSPSGAAMAFPVTQESNSSPLALILGILCGILLCIAVYSSVKAARLSKRNRELDRKYRDLVSSEQIQPETIKEKRRFPRVNRLIEVDFSVAGRFYRGFIESISAGGTFIETPEIFNIDELITISYPAPTQAGNIKRKGKIIRQTEQGIGIIFLQPETDDCGIDVSPTDTESETPSP